MRKMTALLSVAAILLGAGPAMALNGSASVVCENGQHALLVTGYYHEDYDGEIAGIVFKREIVGLCLEPEYLPGTPLPFEPQMDRPGVYYFRASVKVAAPANSFAYRYVPYAVRPDDTLVPMTHSCDNDSRNYALVSCGNTPIGRGRLEPSEYCGPASCVRLVLCSESCWSEPIEIGLSEADAASEEPIQDLIGQIVDVYGNRTRCAMPGGNRYSVSLIERSPEGLCTSLPTQDQSWGALKGLYN